jgi:hypothetical protein
MLGGAGGGAGAALGAGAGAGVKAAHPDSKVTIDSTAMPGRPKIPFVTRYSIIPDLIFGNYHSQIFVPTVKLLKIRRKLNGLAPAIGTNPSFSLD